jgi:hypothetical protein
MAHIDRKQEKLVEGPQTEAMRKRAMARLGELLRFKELNAAPDSGKLTVAGVIDLYLEHAKTKYAERRLRRGNNRLEIRLRLDTHLPCIMERPGVSPGVAPGIPAHRAGGSRPGGCAWTIGIAMCS